MAAPTGNEYYKLRTKHGRDKKYKTPELLVAAINPYFKWCLDNPFIEEIVHGKDSNIIEVNKMRPFTLEGLCNFIDLSVEGFKEYGRREDDFSEVYIRTRQIIDTQQLEGAASGFLKESIISRKLGLVDKKQHEHKGNLGVTGFNYVNPQDKKDEPTNDNPD